ncbi:unnamed protein product [Arctia plantaginis]|uniref:Cysteine dioxygenase n=1 Tax=Arctia plantaginis TaxID=874455 RepID=A0A8S1BXC9_ARCPL|nr:unnamed protein product [Arctia plantaginis]
MDPDITELNQHEKQYLKSSCIHTDSNMDVENGNCKKKVSQCTDMEILPIEKPLKVDVEIKGLQRLIEELHVMFSRDYVNVHEIQRLMCGYKSNPKDWMKFAKFDRFRYTRNLVDAGNGAFNIMILCWGPGHVSSIHDHADSHCFMKLLSGNLEEVIYDWPDNVQPEVYKVLENNNKDRRKYSSESEDETTDKLSKLNVKCDSDSCHNGDRKNGRCQNGSCHNGNGKCHNDGYQNDDVENGDGYQTDDEDYDVRDMKVRKKTRMEVNDVCYINDAIGLHRVENPSHVDGAVSLHLYCPPFDRCRVFDARTGKPAEVKVTFWSMYGKKIKRVMEANTVPDADKE